MSWDINYESWDFFPVAQKWFGIGEAIAHLKYLEEEKTIKKEIKDNIILFRLEF